MSELEDLIEANSGVKLHRKRVLTAFSHVKEGPLLNVLFAITRPTLRRTTPAAPAHHAVAATGPKIVRKGMVDYRRGMQYEHFTPLP